MAKRKNKLEVVPSSGNAFADLGITNPEEKQTKVRLAVAINQIIQDRNLSQTAAARRLHVNQPKVSALSNYQLDGFSVERLMNLSQPWTVTSISSFGGSRIRVKLPVSQ
jgi:predicted XRE-type DNA-binding protein